MIIKLENMLKSWALRYAACGHDVIPLHSIIKGKCSCGKTCSKPGKHPLTPHGYKDGTCDTKIISGWWSRWPFANIGIVVNNGLCIIDCDPRNGAPETLEAFISTYGTLPDTPIVLTGGNGFHAYYRHTLTKLKSKELLGEGIDFITGGYVIAPPSRHLSGKSYQWKEGVSILNKQIVHLPAWVTARLANAAAYTKNKAFPSRIANYNYISDVIPEGRRNETITSLFGLLLQHKLHPYTAYEIIRCVNDARCNPPLTLEELQTIANSISQRRLNQIKEI